VVGGVHEVGGEMVRIVAVVAELEPLLENGGRDRPSGGGYPPPPGGGGGPGLAHSKGDRVLKVSPFSPSFTSCL